MAAVLNCSLVLIAIFPLQQTKADTTGKKVKNQIIIDQQGNGNSATIKQTGNNSVQGKAILNVSGENNRITLSADNQSFRTNANVRGDSNILLWKPADHQQTFSIHLSAGLSSAGSSNHKDYYFTIDHLEEDLFFYQKSREIIHNH
jgi:outer membrane scaffolding protein for murein synthesis (MipA/OmpV family)